MNTGRKGCVRRAALGHTGPAMLTDPELTHSADVLVPLLYSDLRRLARRARWQVSAGQTVQTTALVNEAYLRLRRSERFNDRQHFMRSAAMAMRQILINLAREALTEKRGAGAIRVDLDDAPELPAPDAQSLLEVHDALLRLHAFSPRSAQVVECRFFGGYSDEDTAAALGMSERTVRREWLKARAWLLREMGGDTKVQDA